MDLSTRDLAQAKEAVTGLLEQLGLAAYLFEVEPRVGNWEVRIECAMERGWKSVLLPVDKTRLIESRTDSRIRDRLLVEWRRALAACKSE